MNQHPTPTPAPEPDNQPMPVSGDDQLALDHQAEPLPPVIDAEMTGPTETFSRTYHQAGRRTTENYETYIDPYGNIVQNRTVDTADANLRRANLRQMLLAISSFLTTALITLLLMRFAFQLLGADGSNSVVRFIYDLSGPFTLGFNGIFNNLHVGAYGIIDFAALVACAMYLILAAGVRAIIRAFLAPRQPEQQQMTMTHRRQH